MAARLALVLVALAALAPALVRGRCAPAPARACAPDGRGRAPRGWVGCAADRGPTRPLSGRERLLSGVPVALDTATAEDLATVPGLTARLAAAIVAERQRRGGFHDLTDLRDVRGIGPVRFARARPHLTLEAWPAAEDRSILRPRPGDDACSSAATSAPPSTSSTRP